MCLTTNRLQRKSNKELMNKQSRHSPAGEYLFRTGNNCIQPAEERFLKSIFSLFGLKYFEKSLLHSDDEELFSALLSKVSKITFNQHFQECYLILFF